MIRWECFQSALQGLSEIRLPLCPHIPTVFPYHVWHRTGSAADSLKGNDLISRLKVTTTTRTGPINTITLTQFNLVAQLCQTLRDSWTAACLASLLITNSQSILKLISTESVMPSTISSSVVLFSSCLQTFPAARSFPMSQLFTSGDQSTGASASVLPVHIQDWFPLGLTSLIFLLSKGVSRVFSSTTIKFCVQPSLWSNSHIHTWLLEKKCSFGYMDLCLQSDVLCLGLS